MKKINLFSMSEEEIAEVKKEIKILAYLDHENIIKYHYAFVRCVPCAVSCCMAFATPAFSYHLPLPHAHPYAPRFREGKSGRQICIVMEYAAGGDLYQRIKKQRESGQFFPEDCILHWFVQIALALRHCHENRILHRDIKVSCIVDRR